MALSKDEEQKKIFISSLFEWYSAGKEDRSPECLSRLEMRVYFKFQYLMSELKAASRVSTRSRPNLVNRSRPNLVNLSTKGIRSTVCLLWTAYGKKLKALGYSEDKVSIETTVESIVIDGAGSLSYCYHCRKVGDITSNQLCPHCHGWFVLEVDPAVRMSTVVPKGSRFQICKRLQRRCYLAHTSALPPLLGHAYTTSIISQEEEITGLPPLCSICQESL